MKPTYIDTHAHVYWDDYTEGTSEVILRAQQAGVKTIIAPGTNLTTSARVRELVDQHDNLYGAVGIHPSDVKDTDETTYLSGLQQLLDHPKIVAVGEIGLDYYWDTSFNDKQHRFFRAQIELALSNNKPVIIHNRNSDDDMISILSDYKNRGLRGVFHCFSGDEPMMMKGLELGFYISIAGVVTFKNSKLKEAIKNCPVDKILTETDAPFLAPHPLRGKRNEPAYVVHVADFLASWFNLSIDDFNIQVGKNTEALFGIR